MNIRDIRIDSLVIFNGKEKKISDVSRDGFIKLLGHKQWIHFSQLEPMPVNYDRLLKYGFKEYDDLIRGLWLNPYEGLQFRYHNGQVELWNHDIIKRFDPMPMHELQNLIWAILRLSIV